MDIATVRALLDRSEDQLTDELLESASFEFSFDWLVSENISDAQLDVVIDLLSNPKYGRFEGTCSFLLELQTDKDKLAPIQIERVTKSLIANVENYSSWLLRHAAGDFIANMFEPADAVGHLSELVKRGTNASKHAAFVGLEIVLRRLSKDDPLFKAGAELMRQSSGFTSDA